MALPLPYGQRGICRWGFDISLSAKLMINVVICKKKPTLFRVPAYHFLDNLKLDVVAPCAEDLVEFRACLSTEVGQHHVAGYVY